MQHEIFLEKDAVIKRITAKNGRSVRKPKKTVRFADLFAGCGGLSHGIVEAAAKNGVQAISGLAVDTKQAALDVYEANIPTEDEAVIVKNIMDLFSARPEAKLTAVERRIRSKVGDVEILVAGPPCQGHSNLNNSTRRNDPRNRLYLACVRAVEVLRPELVVIENVPAVVHATEGVVQTTETRLARLGYSIKHLNINFLDLGLPQARKRHVLIASLDDKFSRSVTTLDERRQVPVLKEFIYKTPKEDGLLSKSGKLSQDNLGRVEYLFKNKLYDLPDEHRPSCHRDKIHSYKSVYGRLHWDKPAQTLTSGYGSMGQGRYIHPSQKRTINSREAARMQGFPDYFSFDSVEKLTDLREMIANAVPPQLTFKIVDCYLKTVLNC